MTDRARVEPTEEVPAAGDLRAAPGERRAALLWAALLVALGAWTAWHLGATHLTATVTLATGAAVRVPDTFALVDHPWHATRASLLLDSLRDGHLPRWVGSHEGGYPVEFYPLGFPWLTIAVWSVLLGSVSILAAYKIAVILLLLAPAAGFLAVGRVARRGLALAGIGLTLHLAVNGGSWDGGYTETVTWGLVTNVAGYTAALGFLGALTTLVYRPGRWALALTVATAVLAVSCNTRSSLALAAAGAGVLLAVAVDRRLDGRVRSRAAGLTVAAGIVALAIAAPVLGNSLRFSAQYEFIRYSWYDGVSDYVSASVAAVSWPVAVIALAGFVVGILGLGREPIRVLAWTLLTYVVLTAALGGLTPDGGLVAQLEATRMMPFQRLLLIGLAAAALVEGVGWLARRSGSPLAAPALPIVAGLIATLVIIWPVGAIPAADRPLPLGETTGQSAYADLEEAVGLADGVAAPGTALLVAGSAMGWHEPMWAPTMTDRPLRYDNWLWLWQTWHRIDGIDYDGQAVAPSSASDLFGGDYLQRTGVGAVVAVTPQLEAIADRSAVLERVPSEGYAVYRVTLPTALASGGAGVTVTAVDWSDDRVEVALETPSGGTLTVHQTWFPRWRADVDGTTVTPTRGENGQLTVAVPGGVTSVTFTYVTDTVDWLFRGMSALGVVLLAVALLPAVRPRWAGERSG